MFAYQRLQAAMGLLGLLGVRNIPALRDGDKDADGMMEVLMAWWSWVLVNGLVSFSEVFIAGECIRLDNGGLQMRLHKENTWTRKNHGDIQELWRSLNL